MAKLTFEVPDELLPEDKSMTLTGLAALEAVLLSIPHASYRVRPDVLRDGSTKITLTVSEAEGE